jgi:pimeloyl-ACP methyl ester carboxylesterase
VVAAGPQRRPPAARSTDLLQRGASGALGRRWHAALRDWPRRLELGRADQDPICTEAVLQAVLELRPHADLTRLHEVGHYPQIEDPAATMALIERHASRA